MENFETMEYGCLWKSGCGATGWMAREGMMMMCIMQSVVCGSKVSAKWERRKAIEKTSNPNRNRKIK